MEEVNCSLPVPKPSSDACPTEDAIRALLENLVDPLLPLKPSPTDVPSKALRESVAKQVHAVVLLYNYYHRREHPHLECLTFESFRSLATVMRPALLPHFKESEEDGVLEKVVVDACSLAMSLVGESSDFSSLKKWPIRKVAVLLVDSKKTCCYLQHSSITQGVWSLLEKTAAAEGHNEEAMFQKVAFSAIEEATGVNHKDIVILERHLVHSLSEEKTTVKFYIMKCTSEDKFSGEFPVEEALNCMQGPLFEKSVSEWSTNSIVEYFHVLPYASLIQDWFSRREDAEFVIEKEAEAVCDEIESNGKAEESDICPTEDAIRALLENLVDPLLPLKPSPTDVPSKDLRESVARQVHAVVLLYNYYHRKEHPHLECLSSESFRSLTSVMRPGLLPHFKESGDGVVLLEKVVVDACSLSNSLGASSDISSLKKWPISKVAVLLVDSKKTCCYLQHSSITQGVWSLLEKPIEREITSAAGGQNEEAIFQKVAFAAIKEATGINHNDIVILKRHLVQSLSEEKTTTQFYIMKCSSEDKFCGEFSVDEALNCMQGPLFEKSFSEWSTNSIVEYFHVLPYASLITDWFSRREDAEFVIEKEAEAVCDVIESNEKADESDICPTEGAIRALLENLVDPLLPHKPSPTDVPSKAVRESVATQVHAVVVLYNYYHRREHPHLECLSLESFRSLATVMRPALLPHFKESGDGVVMLEKVIADACSLSMSLEASSDFSSLKKWPIKKVAVLLVDSKKTCCYLQHSSITQGVWSLLEKTATAEGHNEEAIFQKIAFAAIKEATGINHKDVVILERHLVQSLSEEKTTAKFYIMKCTSQDKFSGEFPVEEALNCMQGPLFEKSFSVSEWSTSFIVEYFHVLPYASLITDWFSRREDTEFVIEKEAEAVCDEIESNGKADESDIFDTPAKRSNDTNARKDATARSSPKARKKVAPKTYSRILRGRVVPAVEPQVERLKAKNADNEMSPCKESYPNGEIGGCEVGSGSNYHRERDNQRKKAATDKLKSILRVNASSPVSAHDSNLNLEELQTTLLSKATSLSETALKVLHCKRDKLTLQQRDIEDEIAECDKRIKNISGNWELQLETILETCNESYSRRTIQESHDKSACQSNKRMKLSEPLPSAKSMCQKLDDICLENNWALPNYRVSSTDGGYEAEVRIKETHFPHTICGEEKSDAEEARESAAACLLTRLQHNTRQQPSTSRHD